MTDKEKAALVSTVYEAMRFALWAAGQGIFPEAGEPAVAPEDFLFEYSKAVDVDDWDGLPELFRDEIKSAFSQDQR